MKSILDIFYSRFYSGSKNSLFATALLFAFSLFARAEMVDTYQFQNQDDRTRAVELAKSLRCPPNVKTKIWWNLILQLLMTCVLKCTKWWMRAKAISKLSIK